MYHPQFSSEFIASDQLMISASLSSLAEFCRKKNKIAAKITNNDG